MAGRGRNAARAPATPTRTGAAPAPFRRFAAIDWSGAKGSRHKGIAIAICETGDSAPVLIQRDRPWSREQVLHWLLEEAGSAPTLFGFDFSYAPPIVGRGSYLPGEAVPGEAKPFWAYVDGLCADEDLGAASFLEQHHRRHFYFGAADGAKSDFLHHRLCELRFNALGGGKASTLYDAIGAAQVAKASFAGMRLLHRLDGRIKVWPFDCVRGDRIETPASASLVVEIYTRLFIRLAGLDGRKIRSKPALDRALAGLASRPAELAHDPDDHQTDVLVAAAGLRAIAGDRRYWKPDSLTPAVARAEGWTFGIL